MKGVGGGAGWEQFESDAEVCSIGVPVQANSEGLGIQIQQLSASTCVKNTYGRVRIRL